MTSAELLKKLKSSHAPTYRDGFLAVKAFLRSLRPEKQFAFPFEQVREHNLTHFATALNVPLYVEDFQGDGASWQSVLRTRVEDIVRGVLQQRVAEFNATKKEADERKEHLGFSLEMGLTDYADNGIRTADRYETRDLDATEMPAAVEEAKAFLLAEEEQSLKYVVSAVVLQTTAYEVLDVRSLRKAAVAKELEDEIERDLKAKRAQFERLKKELGEQ